MFRNKSKLIIAYTLINSILVNTSFASTLSDDTRYEYFETDTLNEIDNLLEEQSIDIEIEGETLSNIINYDAIKPTANSTWTINRSGGYLKFTQSNKRFENITYPIYKPLEINKEYTLFMNITKNTMISEDAAVPDKVIKVALARDFGENNVVYIKPNQTGVVKYVFSPKQIDKTEPYITSLPDTVGEFEFENLMILEGNHADKDISFIEGMMSAGEPTGSIDLLSFNKDLSLAKDSWIEGQIMTGGHIYTNGVSLSTKDRIYVKPNTQYTISTPFNDNKVAYHEWKGNGDYIKDSGWIQSFPYTFTTSPNAKYIKLTSRTNSGAKLTLDNLGEDILWTLTEGDTPLESSQPQNSIKTAQVGILGCLPSGKKDRIIIKDGKFVIERNLGFIEFDGSPDEDWRSSGHNPNVTNGNYIFYYNNIYNTIPQLPKIEAEVICDKLRFRQEERITPTIGIQTGVAVPEFRIAIPTPTYNDTECNTYLQKNPIKIVYELETPTYEIIPIDLSLPIFEGNTYVTNNSVVPVKMNYTVDRVANRAYEFVSMAISSPTSENISKARYWTNLLRESSLKDSLQNNITDINSLDDLKMEHKSFTVAGDIYINPKNTLSLTLDTNKIIFDDVDLTERTERKNAVNLTVNSSLPYRLNAYLEEEIANKDKTVILDKSILNIKASNKDNYSIFTSTKNPLVLLDNQDACTNNVHGIDIMLNPTNVPKTDVYKTVLKFEVEQK